MLVIMALISFHACKKDEFINLSSSISIESSQLGTTEGGSVIANLILTEKLSEDVLINVEFNTEDIIHYINEDDYDPVLEYSDDLGKTWNVESNTNQIRIPALTTNLKIRFNTIDDQKLELHEKVKMVFTPVISDGVMLTGELDAIEILIKDDEPINIPSDLINENLPGIVFSVNENYDFELQAFDRNNILTLKEKEIIDNGLDPQMIADIKKITTSGAVPITRLIALYENNGLGGYVENERSLGTPNDQWTLAVNLFHAYNFFDFWVGETFPQKYNANGAFGYILTHEYGHILTLNKANQINNAIDIFSGDVCTTFATLDGCFLPDAHLNKFSNRFYDNTRAFIDPKYVSFYAEVNILEDIAETFAFYIAQDNIPLSNETSSGALQKLNFIVNQSGLAPLKEIIGNDINIMPDSTEGFIYNFNRDKNGKKVSCLDHEKIIQAFYSNDE